MTFVEVKGKQICATMFSKILECIMYNRCYDFMTKNNVLLAYYIHRNEMKQNKIKLILLKVVKSDNQRSEVLTAILNEW